MAPRLQRFAERRTENGNDQGVSSATQQLEPRRHLKFSQPLKSSQEKTIFRVVAPMDTSVTSWVKIKEVNLSAFLVKRCNVKLTRSFKVYDWLWTPNYSGPRKICLKKICFWHDDDGVAYENLSSKALSGRRGEKLRAMHYKSVGRRSRRTSSSSSLSWLEPCLQASWHLFSSKEMKKVTDWFFALWKRNSKMCNSSSARKEAFSRQVSFFSR